MAARLPAKRAKRSLKVRKSTSNDLLKKQGFQKEAVSIRIQDEKRNRDDKVVVAGHSSGKKTVQSDNSTPLINKAEEEVSETVKKICAILPGYLGVDPADWRNVPPLPPLPQSFTEPDQVPATHKETSESWAPLPPVCFKCARRKPVKHEPYQIDHLLDDAGENQPSTENRTSDKLPSTKPDTAYKPEVTDEMDFILLDDDISDSAWDLPESFPTGASKINEKCDSEKPGGSTTAGANRKQSRLKPLFKKHSVDPKTPTEPPVIPQAEPAVVAMVTDKELAMVLSNPDEEDQWAATDTSAKKPETITESKRNNPDPAPLTACPLCTMNFDVGSSQMDIDGHIAACLAAAGDDVIW